MTETTRCLDFSGPWRLGSSIGKGAQDGSPGRGGKNERLEAEKIDPIFEKENHLNQNLQFFGGFTVLVWGSVSK